MQSFTNEEIVEIIKNINNLNNTLEGDLHKEVTKLKDDFTQTIDMLEMYNDRLKGWF